MDDKANVDINLELVSEEQYYLRRLSIYLNYELSTVILYLLSHLGIITLILVVIAATVFAPYMLFVFFKLRKFAWIVSFVVMVIFPLIICIIIGLKVGYLPAFILIPLGFFYFYCFILKFSVSDQLKEISTREERKRKMEEDAKEKLLWLKQFEK